MHKLSKRFIFIPFLLAFLLAFAAGCGKNSAGELPEIGSLEELKGKKVGVLTGSSYDGIMDRLLPEAKKEFYNNYPDQAEALKNGKLDGFVIDEPLGRDLLNHTEGLTHLEEYLSEDSYAFALPKGKEELLGQIDAIITEMKEDGTMEAIDAKWFSSDEAQKKLPEIDLTGENGTLRFATNSGQAPFTYIKDGELIGYDVDVMTRVCEKLGYKLEIFDMDFAAIIPGITSGKYDIAGACITITEERKESVDFTVPDYTGGVVMMVRDASATGQGAGFASYLKSSFEKTFIREGRWKLIVQGLGVTALISVCSAVLGSILGFGICMMRRSGKKLLSVPAKGFVAVIQGTPIVVILMILFYLILTGVDNGAAVAVAGFSLNFAAYVSEMMRTGIDAVDPGQIEAATAMGFKKSQVFTKITFPQAARHFLPVYKGELISMVKMTSVVGYIAIQDLTKMGDIIRSRTYDAFFPLITTAVIYFLLAQGMAQLLGLIERRLDPKFRKREVKGVKNL